MNRRHVMRAGTAGAAAVVLLGAGACAEGVNGAGDDFPEGGELTIIAAGSPGGGLDTQARMVEQVFTEEEDLSPAPLSIENIGGGGGNPARAAVLNRNNDGRTLVAESNRVFLNNLTGTTDMTAEDFTPVAKLTTEYVVWAVPADSEWESAEQVLDEIQDDPEAASFGVGTAPSDDQFNVLEPARASGIDDPDSLNVVVFEEGGDLTANLVGGHVDIASTGYSEVADQVEAGEVRLLASSAPEGEEVPEGMADVPTWQELGLEYTVDHWRGVFGPADMPDEAVEWWVETLEQGSESGEWQELADRYKLTTDFEGPDEFAQTIEEQRAGAEESLGQNGN